jgi:oligopeptide/dipeptide ABC transporter ATP-binding protein
MQNICKMEEAMEPLLKVTNLKTSFKIHKQWIPAVENVSFCVNPGETLGIVGESGCGKSVTSMSILQLLPKPTTRISADEILLRGKDISGLSDKELAQIRGKEIGMIFQDSMTSLNPVKTIGKQLDEAFIVHHSATASEAPSLSIEMLKKVGIPSADKRYKEYPHQLSGGMRQRVMIAMALAQNPSLIIADEPTTALDVTIQAQIMDLMKKMKEETGVSIILITHDMGVVAEMADKILVMYAGMVIEYASARDIFKNPLHPYTKGLLASIPRKDKDIDRLHTIEGTVPTLSTMPKGCRFCERCSFSMNRCRTECPEMYSQGERMVRCFLYEKDGEMRG